MYHSVHIGDLAIELLELRQARLEVLAAHDSRHQLALRLGVIDHAELGSHPLHVAHQRGEGLVEGVAESLVALGQIPVGQFSGTDVVAGTG